MSKSFRDSRRFKKRYQKKVVHFRDSRRFKKHYQKKVVQPQTLPPPPLPLPSPCS